jgi:hypothetical protein
VSIGASILLLAVGAILKFAVTAHVAHVDLQVVGVILMIAGGVGLVISLAMFASTQRRRTGSPPTGRPPTDAY